jgi:hypothetical protein
MDLQDSDEEDDEWGDRLAMIKWEKEWWKEVNAHIVV